MTRVENKVTPHSTVREKMLAILRKEPIEDIIVSPIAESDFAASANNKEWCSDVSGLDDYLRAAQLGRYDPIFDVILDFGSYDPQLKWQVEVVERDNQRIKRRHVLKTPVGNLEMLTEEAKHLVPYTLHSAINKKEDYRVLEWYFRKMAHCADAVHQQARQTVRAVGDRGLVRICAGNTFELNFIKYPDIIMQYIDHPDLYRHAVKVFFETQQAIIKTALDAGVDLVYTSGVAAEMMSPAMFEETFLPTLIEAREFTHQHNGYFYYHSCGLTKNFIDLGFYNDIRPDIFETLSPPPYGEIDDLRQARQALHPDICTRGNLDTEIMRSGTPQQIVETVTSIIDATWGYRHIVGLADSLLWGTPIDNVRCMVQAAKTHYANRNGIHPATTENHGPDSALE